MKTKAIKVGEVRFGQGFKFMSAAETFRWYRVRDVNPVGSVAIFDSVEGKLSTARLSDTVLVADEPQFIIVLGDDYYWSGFAPTQVRSSAKLYPTREAAFAAIENLPSYIGPNTAGTAEA